MRVLIFAALIAASLIGCGPSDTTSSTAPKRLGIGESLKTVQHGDYTCIVYDGLYAGGLWCERAEVRP